MIQRPDDGEEVDDRGGPETHARSSKWGFHADHLLDEMWPDATPTQQIFLRWLADTGELARACRYAGITPKCMQRWMRDSDFHIWYQEAFEMATQLLEDKAYQMAQAGAMQALLKLLEARKPKVYSPRGRIVDGGQGAKRVIVQHTRPPTLPNVSDGTAPASGLSDQT